MRPLLPAALLPALLCAAPLAAASVTKPSLPSRHSDLQGVELASGPGEVVLLLPLTGPEDAEPDWLGAGAARYLGEAVRLAGYRVVDEEDRRAALHEAGLLDARRVTLASAVVLARQLGARYVISGEWAPEPPGLRLSVSAVDARDLSLLRRAEAFAGRPEVALAELAVTLTGEAGRGAVARRGLEELARTTPAALNGWLQAAAEPEQAEGLLRSARSAAPDFEPVRLAWAEYLLDAGRIDEAGPALDGLSRSSVRHRRARALALEGRLALALGQHDEAVRRLGESSEALPETGTLLWLAEAQLAAGDSMGAGRTVQQALAQSPTDEAALELLARAREAGR